MAHVPSTTGPVYDQRCTLDERRLLDQWVIAVKVLRWGAWSWADGRLYPEPPCPTDDEFAAVQRSFGYEPWTPTTGVETRDFSDEDGST